MTERHRYHRIAFIIGGMGDGITAHVTCTAPDGATCRMNCPNGCEYACDHEKVDMGECGQILWITEDNPIDYYVGPDTAVRDGDIELIWNGDGMDWKYVWLAPAE